MLEKVTDIKFNSQMAENKNGYKKSRGGSAFAYNKSNHFDSIDISPAFQFIAKMNFKILNIFNTSANKYEVVFELNEFIFDIIIDLPLLIDRKEIQFKITSKENENSGLSVFLKTNYDDKNSDFSISTKMIKELFNRINENGFKGDSTLFDQDLLSFLFEGIEERIFSEMNNISKSVIHFIESLYEIKIFEKLEDKKSKSENIQIQLIKSTEFSGIHKSE